MIGINLKCIAILLFNFIGSVPGDAQLTNYMVIDYERERSVTEKDIELFVDATLTINQAQRQTQQRMWELANEYGPGIHGTYHMLKVNAENDPESAVKNREYLENRFSDLQKQFAFIEQELKKEIIRIVEKQGVRLDRFLDIYALINRNRSYQDLTLQIFKKRAGVGSRQDGRSNLMSQVSGESRKHEIQDDYPVYIHHLTAPGHTLWDLAEMYFGQPGLWPVLMQHNSERILRPRHLMVGTMIRVPANFMRFQPDPLITVDEKLEMVESLFPFEDYRLQSFGFASQQLDMQSLINVHTSIREVQNQINENSHLRGELYEAPDFLSVLLPVEKLKDDEDEEEAKMAVDNMIIDETRTPFGSDFYDRFNEKLEFPESPSASLIIRVVEQPVPGRGSQITIELNYEEVYQFQIQPVYDELIETADAAAQGLNTHMRENQQQGLNFY